MTQTSKRHRPRKKSRQQPRQQRNFEFTIEDIDGLGQGIAQDGHSKCFIPDTLPGETGTARVESVSKGVSFGRVEELHTSADNRVKPACEHFADCPACHFLHTDYGSELRYKRAALARLCRSLPVDTDGIEVLRAPSRQGYRNRVQLHYRHKHLGMLDGRNDRVVEVPRCQIIDSSLQPAFDKLYADKSWSEQHKGSGHCEIYARDGVVHTSWDQPYAQGGFTQVNDAMNAVLRDTVLRYAGRRKAESMLELFAGTGNLSEPLLAESAMQRVMVDYTTDKQQQALPNYYNLDLYDESALSSFGRRESSKAFDLVLLDPPRKGFSALPEWVARYKPRQLIYVSCNAATLVRDVKALHGKFAITDMALVDLFPGTHHFETLVRLEFRHHRKS